MGETVIVYDIDGNQISPIQNEIGKIFKNISGKEIAIYLRQVPAYVQAIKDFIPTETVKLVFSGQTQELLKNGAKFGNSKYGGFAANLYDKAGTLIGQASFTEEQNLGFSSGLSNSINQLMLQQQFGEIIAMLDIISANIERVLVGQQNDRIALCASAEQQLLEASKINNDGLRRLILTTALQTAHQARSSLTQTFIDDIGYLKDYNVSLFGKSYEKDIKPRTQAIKQSILANYRATKICAVAYAGLEEYAAMTETLSAYEKLLTSQLTDDTLEKLNSIDSENVGFWLDEPSKMSNEIVQFINSNNSLALEIPVSLLKGDD